MKANSQNQKSSPRGTAKTRLAQDKQSRLERSLRFHQGDWRKEPATIATSTLLRFRDYQLPVFQDRSTGVMVLHWARQIGKSFTLAAWAVDRLLTRPGRLVTVLSNSRENGAEFLRKCVEICELTRTRYQTSDIEGSLEFENMQMELRIRARKKLGRIKVLAANPRTARGFSGDLILDEFAFHEDAEAIWEAAEPILSSNQDFLCRIASTGNGSHNLFHRLAEPASAASEQPANPGSCLSIGRAGYALSRVTRTMAFRLGVKIFDPHTRAEISPEASRATALDKRAYDQNYECAFDQSSYSLLTHELIDAAERCDIGLICEQNWSSPIGESNMINGHRVGALEWLRESVGPLFAGFDVARKVDFSVITVMEKLGDEFRVRAILRMRDVRLEQQKAELRQVCQLPNFRRCAIDMTGLGFGLVENLQEEFKSRIQGINFASSVPLTEVLTDEGRQRGSVRVTESLALELLQVYENRRIQHPGDPLLRADLCKPERAMTPGGRVSIAATRDAAGHADHFWSFALAIEAAASAQEKFAFQPLNRRAV